MAKNTIKGIYSATNLPALVVLEQYSVTSVSLSHVVSLCEDHMVKNSESYNDSTDKIDSIDRIKSSFLI